MCVCVHVCVSHRYIITYRPDQGKAHVLLREGATTLDCLKGSFAAYLFLYLLDGHQLSDALSHNATAAATGGRDHKGAPAAAVAQTAQAAHPDWQAALSRTTRCVGVREKCKRGMYTSQFD